MNWDEYFGRILYDVAAKSKDVTQFGALVVDRHFTLRSTGYNGLPRGLPIDWTEEFKRRPEKYWWWIHAEANAIYNAARAGIQTDECSMYVITVPCLPCMSAIIQAGIKEVVYFNDPPPMDGETWRDTTGKAVELAQVTEVLLRRGGDR